MHIYLQTEVIFLLKEKVFWWSIAGFFFVCIAGTINHFLYELSGNNAFVGMFVPVNESVREHLKLLFFPFLFLCIIEFAVYGKHMCNFLISRFFGVLCGLIMIPVVFGIYSGIIGKSIVAADIILFFAAVFVSYLVSYIFISKQNKCIAHGNIIAIILFLITAILFVVFSFV